MAEKGPITIISSNVNVRPLEAVRWGVKEYRAALSRMGYAAMAYTPLHNRMALEISWGADINGLVAVTHQPFRELALGALIRRASRKHSFVKGCFDVAVNLGMPQMADGDRVAANVQRRLRPENRGPHLVHPYGQEHGPKLDKPPQGLSPRPDYRALHDQLDSPFTDLQWQFTIEYAKNRGTYAPGKPEKTAEDTVAVAHEDGLGQVAADANHLLAVRQGYQFTVDEAETIVAWLANNRQLGVFEFDVQPHLGGKIATLESVIQGNIEKTDHGRLLAVAAQNTPPGDPFNLKVEVPAYAFEANFENGGLGFDYETGHKWLVPILTNHVYDNLPAAA